jgi:uncharacterized protein YjbI with pentapeptide repeats
MADNDHTAILLRGVEAWNAWRAENEGIRPDVSGLMLTGNFAGRNFAGANLSDSDLSAISFDRTDLSGADLSRADLRKATIRESNLSYAKLTGAAVVQAYLRDCDLHGADLAGADFSGSGLVGVDLSHADLARIGFTEVEMNDVNLYNAKLCDAKLPKAKILNSNLTFADLTGADLSGVNLTSSNLSLAKLIRASLPGANLDGATLLGASLNESDLSGANLTTAVLVGTNVTDCDLRGCKVYGASVWNLKGTPRDQSGLVVTPRGEPTVRVDDLEVAQFVYLLIKNEKLRRVIDAMTGRAVLILGRFTPERMAVLEAIADELRRLGELPILFNFDKPVDRSTSETVRILAGLCKFLIVDLTDPKSAPYECHLTVPDIVVPVFPIIQQGQQEFSMFEDLYDYDWVLEGWEYRDVEHLRQNVGALREDALRKREEISERRGRRRKGFRKSLGPGSVD